MISPDFKSSPEAVRKLIHTQAASRLESQCAFAGSQDSRAVTLISASTSLGAAATAISIAASATADRAPLAWAAGVATLGFALAAGLALLSLRSRGFHAQGWYPHDFAGDIEAGKAIAEIEDDVIQDLEIRLRHNSRVLQERGRIFNAAAMIVAATPLLALFVGLVMT